MFLEKSYRGNNKWYFYILTLIIVFAAVQVASIPLAIYSIIMNPEIRRGGTNSILGAAHEHTNLGLALMLFTFAGGVIALLLCVKYFHHKKPTDILTGRNRFDVKRVLFGAAIWGLLTIVLLGAQYGFGDTSNLVFQFQPFNFIMHVHRYTDFHSLPSGIRGIYLPGISDARLHPTFQIQMGSPITYRFCLRITPWI